MVSGSSPYTFADGGLSTGVGDELKTIAVSLGPDSLGALHSQGLPSRNAKGMSTRADQSVSSCPWPSKTRLCQSAGV